MRIARPGPGNGWRQTIVPRQAQLLTDSPDFVLEQPAEGFDELEAQVVRQASYVVVALDVGRPLAAP